MSCRGFARARLTFWDFYWSNYTVFHWQKQVVGCFFFLKLKDLLTFYFYVFSWIQGWGLTKTLQGYRGDDRDPLAHRPEVPEANAVRDDTLKGPLTTPVNHNLAWGIHTLFPPSNSPPFIYLFSRYCSSAQQNEKPPRISFFVYAKLCAPCFIQKPYFNTVKHFHLHRHPSHLMAQSNSLSFTLDIVDHSTSRFFSPFPEHTVKVCTSHWGVMMAHSVTRGHPRRQRFSMHKVDHFEPLHQRGGVKKIKGWHLGNTGTPSKNGKPKVPFLAGLTG